MAEVLADATGSDIVALRDLVRRGKKELSVPEGKAFGVVMPSYWGTVPSILRDWLEGASVSFGGTDHYCYLVGTYGAYAGRVCSEGQRVFAPLGVEFDATYTVPMVDNWNPYFGITPEFVAESEPVPAQEAESLYDDVASWARCPVRRQCRGAHAACRSVSLSHNQPHALELAPVRFVSFWKGAR